MCVCVGVRVCMCACVCGVVWRQPLDYFTHTRVHAHAENPRNFSGDRLSSSSCSSYRSEAPHRLRQPIDLSQIIFFDHIKQTRCDRENE